jgi:hypothetical protein
MRKYQPFYALNAQIDGSGYPKRKNKKKKMQRNRRWSKERRKIGRTLMRKKTR